MPTSTNFAPNSYFFTDPSAITQDSGQAFGPVSADEFQLTSKFTLASDANAYAICTGIALVQPQTGSNDLVNLILRPFKQPITGLNIKYFIYRGLSIGDFFDSTNTNVIAAGSDTSDFINKINASFAAYYTSTSQTAPTFLAKYIGFDPANQPDSTMISDLFFKIANYTSGTENTQTAFELPLISAGASLGSFAAGECGIDVVLDYGDYQLPTPNDQFVFDLDYARASEASIDLSEETDDFKKKLLKEQIFQFLDVAAYYGFHYGNGVVVTGDGSGSTTKNKGDDIYTLIRNFYTKNNLYLYIQSDRTRSYNFYGNYQISETNTNTLKIGVSNDVLTESAYDTNGWPLLVYNTPQDTTDATSSLFFQFVTDNNDNTVLYGQVAQIENASGNNFCGPADLRLPDNTDGTPSVFTEVIELSNPVSGPDGAKPYVATFNILIYQGQTYDYVAGQTTDDQGNTTNVTAQPAFFDDVFGELNATPLFKANDDSSYSVVSSSRLKLINHFYNGTQYGASAVQTLIVNDVLDTGDSSNPSLHRVIYISEAIDTLSNVVSTTGTVSADTQTFPSQSGSASGSETYQLPSASTYSIIQFTDDSDQINGIEISSSDNTLSSKILLGLTKDENDLLKALNSDNNLTNVRLYLLALFDSSNELVSTENIIYQKFKAGVVGEDASGQLQLKLPNTDVNVYSLDQKYYYTKAYSDYMTTDDSVTSLVLDLDISL